MIEKLQAHYGFTRMPFGRDLAPGMLHRHASHNEAVARITWCISERAIGVITGEVGAGKTVAVRAALHAYLDDFGHEEADVLREIKQLLEKLPYHERFFE